MASIHFLLNPAPEKPVAIHPEIDSNRAYFGVSMTRNLPPGRHKSPAKYKMPKDAPVFKKGDPQGELRYPPCEDRPEEIAEEHQKLKMHPMGADGKISDFARTIPYKSDKKSFEGRTGRRKLEGIHSLDSRQILFL